MDERPDVPEADGLDAEHAAQILRQASEQARRELGVSYPVVFAIWGATYLLGYGAVWLSVRDQHPFTGPSPAAVLVLVLIVAFALAATVVLVGRAISGVGGGTVAQRRNFYLAITVAYIGMLGLEGALAHAGASKGLLSIYGAAAPMLLTGLFYLCGAAVRMQWPVAALGGWLIVVAAGGAYAGRVGVWGVDALAAGLAFLGAAVLLPVGRTVVGSGAVRAGR